MKKFKRILSAILIAAMALSLMPTFASAEETTTYTYVFNPTSVETQYTTTTHTFETTKSAGSAPWEYLGKYGLTSTHPIGKKWTNGNIDMYMSTSKNTHGYAAFKIQIPESGIYSAELSCTTYKTSGSINVYVLPGDTTLNYEGTDTFGSEYKLNNSEISLYSSSTAYDTPKALDNTVDVLATDIGENGAERILVIQSSAFYTGQSNNYMYIDSLTLTKTAEAEGDGEVTPPEEDEEAPITLRFDKNTVTVGANKVFNTFSANDGQNFSFVPEKSSSTTGGSSSIQDYGLIMNNMRAGGTGKNWLAADKTNDKYAGMLTISANDIPAGKYKLSAGVHNFTRGAGVYYYVNDEYVGFDNAYATIGAFNDTNVTTEETIGYITITDSDNDSSTANPVEISLCSAAVDYATSANLYVLRNITFTPVDEIPSYGDLTYEVTGATAAGDGYTVENNTTLSLTAMLSGKHLNGYTLDGTKDNNNYIKVSSSDESIVSVTDTNAALDSEAIYASGYKPVYTLTAHKSNASATITVEAIVDGDCVAEKTFTVSVAKSDTDEYNSEATFAWGTTLPDSLKDKVTVTEKDGASVSAGEITASKGTTYVLSAEPEISDGDTTYKFIGWKRGATGSGAVAFIGYEVEDEYTVWSNTYITAVYDEIKETDEKTVEFYDQDGFYLGAMTESQLETNGLPTNNPKLLGHTFSKWQYVDNGVTKEFTATTELTEKVTRVVALQTPAKVAITYKNENDGIVAEKTYDYDQEVNALGDSNLSDVKYWKLLVGNSEKTVRTSNGYNFYAWENATIKAYTVDVEATDKSPKVVLHGTPRDDSYMIEYDRYSSSYTIVEAGILLGGTETISILSCDKKYTSAKGGRAHGQFAAPHENYDYVRGYIIYKTNSTSALSVVYTDTMPTEK